jgi:Rod binding domain-containing protein
MDIQLSPAALTAIPRTPVTPSNSDVIPENETFHSALRSASDTPEKIGGVAKQFEALMIEQMLKSARDATGGGWLGSDDDEDDQTGSLVMDLAEQGLSQAMAARGGLGIAKMVTANLERSQAASASVDETKAPSSDSEAPAPPSLKTAKPSMDSQR